MHDVTHLDLNISVIIIFLSHHHLVTHFIVDADDGVGQGRVISAAFLIVIIVQVFFKGLYLELILLALLENGVAKEIVHVVFIFHLSHSYLDVILAHGGYRQSVSAKEFLRCGSNLIDFNLHGRTVCELHCLMAPEQGLITGVAIIPKGIGLFLLIHFGQVDGIEILEYRGIVQLRIVLKLQTADTIAQRWKHGTELTRFRVCLDVDSLHGVVIAAGTPREAFHKT